MTVWLSSCVRLGFARVLKVGRLKDGVDLLSSPAFCSKSDLKDDTGLF